MTEAPAPALRHRQKAAPEPMPDATRYGLIAGAVLLVAVAAWINISHTRDNAGRHGADYQTALVVGLIPDVMLVLSVMRLRYHRRSVWAWAGVLGSVSLVAWSALTTSPDGVGAKVVSLVCVAAAVIATGQAHVPHGEPVEILIAHADALADDASRTAATVRADAEETVRQAHADASAQAAGASAESVRLTVRVAELEASAEGLRTQLADAQQAVREASGQPSGKRPAAAKRTPGKASGSASGSASGRPSDMQGWREAREQFKASVRASAPWTNDRLACALAGCTDACTDTEHQPTPDTRAVARKRASDWRREVEAEASAEEAAGSAR